MTQLTLAEQRDAIRKGEIHSRELHRAHLDRIERLDPHLRAFVRIFDEYRDPPEGPLRGVPVTVKDSFDCQGEPTWCGSRYRLSHCAANDSACLARLRAAGAILLGKTNCPEFLANYETDNAITGRTANPWMLERSAGGSSGGEAAAIAASMSAGGVGSDGGGSIRIPAAFCGIAGLKPTPGRVSAAGHVPEIAHPGGLLGVAGPMARTVEDVRILFEALAGYDARDPFSVPISLQRQKPEGVRIGTIEQWYGTPVAQEMKHAVAVAANHLRDAGFIVEPFEPNGLERTNVIWDFFFNTLSDPFKRQIIASNPSLVHWTGTELLKDPPAEPSGVDVVTQLALRDKLRSALLEQMLATPVLLLPTCSVAAFRPRERHWAIDDRDLTLADVMACVTPFNLFGMPSLQVPIALQSDRLPVGIQLAGVPYSEELLLALGETIEQARGPFPTPPCDFE